MIIKAKAEGGCEQLFITMPGLWNESDADTLRSALLDALSNIVSYEEAKNNIKAESLYWLTELITTLTNDLRTAQEKKQ